MRRGQAEKDFRMEVQTIGRVRHKNLVSLLGYCSEGACRMLVYQYMENSNLDKWLHHDDSEISPLTWDIRMRILLGTAKGPQKQTEQLTASLRKKHQNPKVNLHDSLLEMPINLVPTILEKENKQILNPRSFTLYRLKKQRGLIKHVDVIIRPSNTKRMHAKYGGHVKLPLQGSWLGIHSDQWYIAPSMLLDNFPIANACSQYYPTFQGIHETLQLGADAPCLQL
nr:G-type lectin S-receptor-like serine/threonine-protein kinase LECRK3 isoform X2 [Setaria viridis]XP_034589970.1 G-type lectin S-receptor-like serine/threonine-protein kinase LECRK3 isoform X2 [Setaria viridis]